MAKTPKKQTGTALVKWDEELANLAKESAKGAKVTEGKFISFGGGRMSFGGSDIPDDEIRCVVVGWTHANAYYDPSVPYNPKNPQSPLCYSFGVEEEDMEPHTDAPEKQCDNCAECPFNQFESARVGKGKACKNMIRLALIAESDLEDLGSAEVVYASIPPKSLKNWLGYVTKELRDKVKRPHWAVVTLMKRTPDDESQFRVTFKMVELIEDSSLFPELKSLWEASMQGIDFPYAAKEAKPAPAPAKKQKFAARR